MHPKAMFDGFEKALNSPALSSQTKEIMFLLTLALRAFTLIEFVVRQALQNTHQSLAGLYAGNPKRATERPSTEQLLKAFDHLTLYFLPDLTRFMTPLSDLQKRILELMKLPESLYHLHLKQGKT